MIQVNPHEVYSIQIINILTTGFMIFCCISAALIAQKRTEINQREMGRLYYTKSQTLTAEILKVAKSRDTFISSLSHEIRNPLNSIKGSIDYPMAVILCAGHLEILMTAKLSCEILLNLANNVLDAAKLQADKMEICYSESSLISIIEKAFLIHSETFITKKIRAKLYIDKKLPETLRTDPSRFLQIMMNLLSNACKFNSFGGKLIVNVAWCSPNTDQDGLYALNKDPSFEDSEEGLDHTEHPHSLRVIQNNSTSEFELEDFHNVSKNFNLYKTLQMKTIEEISSLMHPSTNLELWTVNNINSSEYHNDQSNNTLGYIKVQVRDTGSGIAEEHIPRLFQMFFQAHQSVNVMHGGTGLGLWICKQLCRKMGGDIKLYSEVNKGTSIVFYIPVEDYE